MNNTPPKRLIILGSTGSIGTQTLDVVRHLNTLKPGSIRVVGLAAGSRADDLLAQAREFNVEHLALANSHDTIPRTGPDAAEQLVRDLAQLGEVDIIMGAIVGIAGLGATLAAVEHGIDVAIANKETLVAAGSLVTETCARTGARLLPVDSEHSALWQAIQGAPPPLDATYDEPRPAPPLKQPTPRLRRMILTASGGPFRETPIADLARVTPAQALDHPTWDMGPKVTIDCASMMNKGLELMEACWLFGLPEDRVEILIQPGSKVHSLVEYDDRSILAHLGPTDMRLPIQLALTWPDRPPAPTDPLDLATLGSLAFHHPDPERYPAIELTRRAMRLSGTAGAALNAANEVAVHAFLSEDNADGSRLAFPSIVEIVARVLDDHTPRDIRSLSDVLAADAEARDAARGLLDAAIQR